MSPKRAINLARVSTPAQTKLYSLDFQLEQMRLYDNEASLTIVAEFKDDTSGRKLERDGLEEACQMLERDEADVLVTWNFHRLHRNYVNSVLLRERIRRAGKEIHYAQSRTISGKTARERLPEDLQFIMAEIDADEIAFRTGEGKRSKAEKGRKWIGLNRPPYGYVSTGRGRNVELMLDEWDALKDPEQAPILLDQINKGLIPATLIPILQEGRATAIVVLLIFIWYVYGVEGEAPLSTLQIARKLTSHTIPTPQDRIPNRAHLKKRGYAEWSRGYINAMIRNTAYMGVFYQFQNKKIGGRSVFNKNKDEWIGVPIPIIVGETLFDAAQKKMDRGRELAPRNARFEYLVSRRISCECGYKIRVLSSK
jgi:DNA invertase Pin-like site-specific DNA recombinase